MRPVSRGQACGSSHLLLPCIARGQACGYLGRVVLAARLAEADAVLATRIKRTGRAVAWANIQVWQHFVSQTTSSLG
jgi:hypothetical protein